VGFRSRPIGLLTDRERVVLQALLNTSSRQELAQVLFVSSETVKAQLRSIYRKLRVNNRDQALQRALELNLLGN
jgi:LuxR family maltose regulon positive regulatory protein